MTNRQVYDVNGRAVTVSPDNPPPPGRRAWALIAGQVVDETTGLPPREELRIAGDARRLTPRVAPDGLVGFAGIPQDAFPRLDAAAYTVNLTVDAARFLTHRRRVTVPADAAFPAAFTPVDLGVIRLHRQPVVLRGRVTRPTALGQVPIPGAAVRLTGFWRTPPPATAPPPPALPNIVTIRPGAAYDRAAAVGVARSIALGAVIGIDKRLETEAAAGARSARISNRLGLLAGNVLAVDTADPEMTEYARILTIAGGPSANEAATVTLDAPFARTHRAGAIARRMNPGAVGGNNAFADAAAPGDPCLLLTALNNLAGAAFVEVAGGPSPAEIHALSLFNAVTDADGFYRLPPLSRVSQIQAEADDGANPAVTVTFRLDYTQPENRLDIAIP